MKKHILFLLVFILLTSCSSPSPAATATPVPSPSEAPVKTPVETGVYRVASLTKIYAGPDSAFFPESGTLAPDTVITILGFWGNYSLVLSEGLEGYVMTEDIEPAPVGSPGLDPLTIPAYNEIAVDPAPDDLVRYGWMSSPRWMLAAPPNGFLIWEIQVSDPAPAGLSIAISASSPLLAKDPWRSHSIVLGMESDSVLTLELNDGLKAASPAEALLYSDSIGKIPAGGRFLLMAGMEKGVLQSMVFREGESSAAPIASYSTSALNLSFMKGNRAEIHTALRGASSVDPEGLEIQVRAIPDGIHNNQLRPGNNSLVSPGRLVLNGDGSVLALQDTGGRVDFVETGTWSKIGSVSTKLYPGGMDFSSSGLVATVGSDHRLAVFNMLDGSLVALRPGWPESPDPACRAQFDYSESLIGMNCGGGLVGLFRASDGAAISSVSPFPLFRSYRIGRDLLSIHGAVRGSTSLISAIAVTKDFQTWRFIRIEGHDNLVGMGDEGGIFASLNPNKSSINIFEIREDKLNPAPVLYVPVTPGESQEDPFVGAEAVFFEHNTKTILVFIYAQHLQFSVYAVGNNKALFSQSFPIESTAFNYTFSRDGRTLAFLSAERSLTLMRFSDPVEIREWSMPI
ncbi:MAG: hypothetical protein JW929_11035 [Anaerolineales bacterium]|nr:hypothetical protein [Anaerolineales bacterium]